VEMAIAMVISSILLTGISVIVTASHKYILNGRSKTQLQQDYTLLEQVLGNKIRGSIQSQQKIYSSYSSYTTGGLPQISGACLKLYYTSGDSVVIYKDGSDFKILDSNGTTSLIEGVVTGLSFADSTTSIATTATLTFDKWSIGSTFVDEFRNFGSISHKLLFATFDVDEDGFTYNDDTFRSTAEPVYASGVRFASGGYRSGALQVKLGGIDNSTILGMSGGWQKSFTLNSSTSVTLSLRYNLSQALPYEPPEYCEVLASVDGILYGSSPNDYIIQIAGGGDSGWQFFQVNLGTLAAGSHSLIVGGYNNKKSASNEETTILIDEVYVNANN